MKVYEWVSDLLYANFEWYLTRIDGKDILVNNDGFDERNDAGEYIFSGYIVNKPDADCDQQDGFQELEWNKTLIPVCVYKGEDESFRYEA